MAYMVMGKCRIIHDDDDCVVGDGMRVTVLVR